MDSKKDTEKMIKSSKMPLNENAPYDWSDTSLNAFIDLCAMLYPTHDQANIVMNQVHSSPLIDMGISGSQTIRDIWFEYTRILSGRGKIRLLWNFIIRRVDLIDSLVKMVKKQEPFYKNDKIDFSGQQIKSFVDLCEIFLPTHYQARFAMLQVSNFPLGEMTVGKSRPIRDIWFEYVWRLSIYKKTNLIWDFIMRKVDLLDFHMKMVYTETHFDLESK